MTAAVGEMARTAKPGARVGAAVWGRAAENPWASLILGTIARHRELPSRLPGTPGLFRCAPPGFMSRIFRDAGLVRGQRTEGQHGPGPGIPRSSTGSS